MKLNKEFSNQIKSLLLKYDPDIVEIIQFGSSVYGLKYARDLDLLIFTKKKKGYGGYLDALSNLNFPYWIDIIVNRIDESLDGLANAVLVFNKILYGDGRYLMEATKDTNKPNYKEAKAELKNAKDILKLGLEIKEKLRKEHFFRNAFNSLFHAVRFASRVYLSTDEKRWGELKKRLPNPYQKEFENYISTLHIKYFYDGNYPKDKVKEEFEIWYNKVKDYIENLQKQS
ncbi:MAG: hypothetical protein AB1422_08275 [bacterium]